MPGLAASAVRGPPDVRLTLGALPPGFVKQEYFVPKSSNDGTSGFDLQSIPGLRVWTEGEFFRIHYKDGTEFCVDRLGSSIWAVWPDQLSIEDTATYLLGPILSLLLRLRGTISLHASAVRIGDVAVALVGPQGAGKSTTAASFATAGYPVLTDDLAAVKEGGDVFHIIPAYPRIRLWPEAVAMLFGSAEALPLLTPGWEKRYLELDGVFHRFEPEPLPLAAIYFLDPRTDDQFSPRIDEEPSREGMVKLIGNIGGNYILDHESPAASFEILRRLAHSVPMRRLIPHTDPQYLPLLREMVVADVRSLCAGVGIVDEGENSRVV